MKIKAVIIALASLILITIAQADTAVLTLDGLSQARSGEHRHGTGRDIDNNGTFDGIMHHGGGNAYINVGVQNKDSGEVRRAMMKWDLPKTIGSIAIKSGAQIKSATLRFSIDFTRQRPFDELMIGQIFSSKAKKNPDAEDFETKLTNIYKTGIEPDSKPGEYELNVTQLVKAQYDDKSGSSIATFVFFMYDEDKHFYDTTALYYIGASGAPTATTLTIETF